MDRLTKIKKLKKLRWLLILRFLFKNKMSMSLCHIYMTMRRDEENSYTPDMDDLVHDCYELRYFVSKDYSYSFEYGYWWPICRERKWTAFKHRYFAITKTIKYLKNERKGNN